MPLHPTGRGRPRSSTGWGRGANSVHEVGETVPHHQPTEFNHGQGLSLKPFQRTEGPSQSLLGVKPKYGRVQSKLQAGAAAMGALLPSDGRSESPRWTGSPLIPTTCCTWAPLLSLLLWVGEPCVGLRPHIPRGREFCSCAVPEASQLSPPEGDLPFRFPTPLTSLYLAFPVLLGSTISAQL